LQPIYIKEAVYRLTHLGWEGDVYRVFSNQSLFQTYKNKFLSASSPVLFKNDESEDFYDCECEGNLLFCS
jgi:hypothetical protein